MASTQCVHRLFGDDQRGLVSPGRVVIYGDRSDDLIFDALRDVEAALDCS